MSSPFSRTMRSVQADSVYPTLVGLIVAIIIFIAWNTWFFFAQVTLYEKSQSARLFKGEIVIAEFSAETLSRIQPGQPARLNIDGKLGKSVGTIPALVTDIINPPKMTPRITGQVKLFAFTKPVPLIRSQDELTGTVEIEVGHLTPAQWVLRTSGLFTH